jgi:serine phosphatase RsbU (regulator of sigma subunit)
MRSTYRRRKIRVEPGDVIVAVTDGITDALEAEEGDPHEALVRREVRTHPDACSSELAGYIIAAAAGSREADVPPDDRTVVVVRVTEAAAQARSNRAAVEWRVCAERALAS